MLALLDQVQGTAAMASRASSVSRPGHGGLHHHGHASGSDTVYTLVIGQNSMSGMMEAVLNMLGTTDAAGVDMTEVLAILSGLEFGDITAVYTVDSQRPAEGHADAASP